MTGQTQLSALLPKGSKLYLSGKITGVKNLNKPLFNKVAKILRKRGYEVINPFDLDKLARSNKKNMTWGDYLRRDIPYLCICDGVVFLPGWHSSRGANLEWKVASGLDMPMVYWGDTYPND